MSVDIWVGRKQFNAGSSAFLKAFFSTVFLRLEGADWGTVYPAIMRELYTGRLTHERAKEALKELKQIRGKLSQLGPGEVVWDFENRDARPPWGDEINSEIRSMADYFVTSAGANLLDVLARAFEESQRTKKDVDIR